MVSYEVSIGFVIVTVLLCVGSLNLSDIVLAQQDGIGTRLGLPNSFLDWHWLGLLPMFVIFFISALAETNRPPFDLVEAESELVAGHMVEYGSTPYMLFMLGEYIAILLMCALTTILFLGGWLPPFDFAPFTWLPGVFWFVLKLCMVFFMFSMVKAFVPRYRYDQLMRLGWKVFLPISLFMVVATAAFLKTDRLGLRRGSIDMSTLAHAAKSLLLLEFISAFFLSMRRFFSPKFTLNYPHEKGPVSPRFRGEQRAAPLSEWRGALHCLQAVRGHLPGAGDHHRGRSAPQRRHAPHRALRPSTW